MVAKVTVAEIFEALHTKYPKAALVPEVTIEDEHALLLQRSYLAKRYPSYRYRYLRDKLPHDAEVPPGYDPYEMPTARRIDVLMLAGKIYTAIEIKRTRADFFNDTAAKRDPWARHVHRFVYLTPAGLVKKEEVPENCGLWEYTAEGGIEVVKTTRLNLEPEDFPQAMIRYLLWRTFSASQANRIRRNRSRRLPKKRG